MTVKNTEVPRKLFPGDGVAVVFPVPFDYDPKNPAIIVTFIDDAGAETVLTEGSSADYTFNPDTGEITIINLTYRPEVGEYIAAHRETDLTQEIGIKHARAYDAELYEDTLDKNIRISQESVLNALRVPGTTIETFDTEIATPEADRTLVIAPDVSGILMGPTANEISNAEQYAQQAEQSANAAEQSAQDAAQAFQTERTWVAIQNYEPKPGVINSGYVDWPVNTHPILDLDLDQDIDLNAPQVTITTELTTDDGIFICLRVNNQASWTISFNGIYIFGTAGLIQPVHNGWTDYVFQYVKTLNEWHYMSSFQGA